MLRCGVHYLSLSLSLSSLISSMNLTSTTTTTTSSSQSPYILLPHLNLVQHSIAHKTHIQHVPFHPRQAPATTRLPLRPPGPGSPTYLLQRHKRQSPLFRRARHPAPQMVCPRPLPPHLVGHNNLHAGQQHHQHRRTPNCRPTRREHTARAMVSTPCNPAFCPSRQHSQRPRPLPLWPHSLRQPGRSARHALRHLAPAHRRAAPQTRLPAHCLHVLWRQRQPGQDAPPGL